MAATFVLKSTQHLEWVSYVLTIVAALALADVSENYYGELNTGLDQRYLIVFFNGMVIINLLPPQDFSLISILLPDSSARTVDAKQEHNERDRCDGGFIHSDPLYTTDLRGFRAYLLCLLHSNRPYEVRLLQGSKVEVP